MIRFIDPAAIIFTMSGRDEDFQEVAFRLEARGGREAGQNG